MFARQQCIVDSPMLCSTARTYTRAHTPAVVCAAGQPHPNYRIATPTPPRAQRMFTHAPATATYEHVIQYFVCRYLLSILIFAVLFVFAGVANGADGNGYRSFEDAFNLSLQSFSTIGYGVLSPQTRWGHAVVFFQSIYSMCFTGVVSGQ